MVLYVPFYQIMMMQKNNSNTKIYSLFADIYDEALSHVPYRVWGDFIDSLFESFFIKKDDAILDIACGTGPVILYLERKYSKMIGLDLSLEMLKKAEKKKSVLN